MVPLSRNVWCWLGALYLLAACPIVLAQNNESLLLEARDAYEKRNEFALAAIAQSLQNDRYLLAPYADYWLMLLRLSESDDATIKAFIQQYAQYPFSDRVRAEWLKKLAKAQNWNAFLVEWPHLQREDTVLTCYLLQAKLNQGLISLEELQNQLKPIWLSTQDQPSACDALFDMAFEKHLFAEPEGWQRFRLALADNKTGLAKVIGERLGVADKAHHVLFDKVVKQPQQALQKNWLPLKKRWNRELYIYAVDRLARKELATALMYWQKANSQFPAEERAYGWGRLALIAARSHQEDSLHWFELAAETTLDKDQQAWRVRAALRDQDWKSVLHFIEKLPEAEQTVATWVYWKGRAYKALGDIPSANAQFVKISQELSYYGLLSKEELGDVITEMPSYYQASEGEISLMANQAGIQRALALYKLEMRAEAKQEWAMAAQGLDDKQLIAAAEIAARSDWLDLAITTAEKTKTVHNFALRYPTPHESVMKSYAKENALDEAWVYGLIRQESRFVKAAKSKVGASGLMQVMPATAKWIAKRLGLKSYQPDMIHELDTNVQFGTHYLRYTMERMNGQPVMATAAYNAGPSRPKRWTAAKPLEGAIYAETIPFSETRDYVKKVMANAYFYAQRLGTTTLTLKDRLGVIPPNGDEMVSAIEDEDTQ